MNSADPFGWTLDRTASPEGIGRSFTLTLPDPVRPVPVRVKSFRTAVIV